MSIKTTTPVADAEKLDGQPPEYYIPERIENASGTAVKFPDGTMICTKMITYTGAESTKWGNFYLDHSTVTLEMGDYAVEFLENPIVNYEVVSGALAWALPILYGSNKRAPKFFLASGYDYGAGIYYEIHMTAIGKWK